MRNRQSLLLALASFIIGLCSPAEREQKLAREDVAQIRKVLPLDISLGQQGYWLKTDTLISYFGDLNRGTNTCIERWAREHGYRYRPRIVIVGPE